MHRRFGRRIVTATVMASLLAFAMVSAALAKCEKGSPEAESPFCLGVVATIDRGTVIQAGTASAIDVTLTQGEEPLRGVSAEISFVRVGGGEPYIVALEPSSEPGHFVAQVNLPAGGFWTLVARVQNPSGAWTDLALETLRVGDAPPVADTGGDGTAASGPGVAPWTWAAVAAVTALAALAATGLAFSARRRRRVATAV